MIPIYVIKISFIILKTNVDVWKIDNFSLQNYEMTDTSFLL